MELSTKAERSGKTPQKNTIQGVKKDYEQHRKIFYIRTKREMV